MRQLFSVSAVAMVAVLLVAGGCGDKHEAAVKKTISTMNDLGAVLKSVKDEASSKAAAPKIKSLTQDMQAQKKTMDSLEKPSAEKEKQLKDKYEKQLDEAMQTLVAESMRIAMDPKLMTPELKAALDGMKDVK